MKVFLEQNRETLCVSHGGGSRAVIAIGFGVVILLLMIAVVFVLVGYEGIGFPEILFLLLLYCALFVGIGFVGCHLSFRWGVMLDRVEGIATLWWRLFSRKRSVRSDLVGYERVVVRIEQYPTNIDIPPIDRPSVRLERFAQAAMRNRGVGKFYPVALEGQGNKLEIWAPKSLEKAQDLAKKVAEFLDVVVKDET